jgi:pimeloyl-ACP methyl ester carboxylesterase
MRQRDGRFKHGSFVPLADLELHWVELGEGRPLVLLHGLGDSHRSWSRVAPMLARSRRVLMPDLAGHGLSERPDASYTLEWHAGVVGAWLEALQLDDVDLVGHSYGGGVAQEMLLKHSPRIRRLGLVAAGGLGREVPLSLRLAALPYVVERFGQPFMAPGTRIAFHVARGTYSSAEIVLLALMNGTPGTARAFARSVRDVIDWRGQYRAFFARAGEISALPQVGLFWGECDPVIPIAHGIDAAALLDGAVLERFAACGHYPHREQPERFVKALEAFLDLPLPRSAARSADSEIATIPYRRVPASPLESLPRAASG